MNARPFIAGICCALLAAGGATAAPRDPAPDAPATQEPGVEKAASLLREGRTEEAAALLREILERAPNHGPARLLAGRIALERGELEAALEHLEIAAAADPPQAFRAWYLLGRVQLLLGRPELAVTSSDRALERAPRFVPALMVRARAAVRLGELERALADAERARALAGPRSEAGLLLAEMLLFEGRRSEAEPLLQEQARESGAEEQPVAEARMLLLAAGGSDADSTELLLLLDRYRHVARAHQARGIALLRTGNPGRAARHFRAALEIDDEDPVPWLYLRRLPAGERMAAFPEPMPDLAGRLLAARRLQEAGDTGRVAEILAPVLERRPHHLPARLLALDRLEVAGDLWPALAGYRELLEWFPDLPSLEARAAAAARSMGALELAACLARRALHLRPDDPWLHFLLAATHSDAEEHAESAESCRRALDLGLEAPAVYVTLGRAESERMRIVESVAAYARALELDPMAVRAVPRFALASLTTEEYEAVRGLLRALVEKGAAGEEALYGLGVMSLRENDLAAARSYFERLDPDDAQVQYNLGIIHLREGRTKEGEAAMEHFRALKEIEDEQWLAHNRAHASRLEARDAEARGDWSEAIRIYTELAASGTAGLEDYLAAGRACLEIGDPRRAYGWFEEVLAKEPYQMDALRGLAAAAEGLGRTDEAEISRSRAELLSWPCEPPP